VAIERWANSDDDQSLPVIMKASMAELRAVTAGASRGGAGDPAWRVRSGLL
jgi:hypothetical protein